MIIVGHLIHKKLKYELFRKNSLFLDFFDWRIYSRNLLFHFYCLFSIYLSVYGAVFLESYTNVMHTI